MVGSVIVIMNISISLALSILLMLTGSAAGADLNSYVSVKDTVEWPFDDGHGGHADYSYLCSFSGDGNSGSVVFISIFPSGKTVTTDKVACDGLEHVVTAIAETGKATTTMIYTPPIDGTGGAGSLTWSFTNGDQGVLFRTVDISAAKSCSATVESVNFGQITAGETGSAELTITKGANQKDTVTITGNDMGTDGSVSLGGNSDVKVKPSATSNIGTSSWVSGPGVNSIPLEITVGKDVSGGDYNSILTATLTCE